MAEAIVKVEKKFYPFDYAVKRAAEQNVLMDYRKHVIGATHLRELDIGKRLEYIQEARTLLRQRGENRFPEYPESEHICVQPS